MGERADRLRTQAEHQLEEAERQHRTSEYPLHGRSTHQGHAAALDHLADTLDEIGEEPPAIVPGNHRATRQGRRVYWLRRKAAEKAVESAAARARSHDMGSTRPLGQPLVGSPARMRTQRNAIDRQNQVSDKAWELHKESEELKRRASAAASNRSIYRDDPEAIPKLRRKLASLESQRDGLKPQRKAPSILNYRQEAFEFRKRYDDGTETIQQVAMTKAEYKRKRAECKGTRIPSGSGHRVRFLSELGGGCRLTQAVVFLTDSKVHPKPEPGSEEAPEVRVHRYAMTNLGAKIRSVKERIAQLEAQEEREERPPRRIGDVEVLDNMEFQKVELHFPGKPDEATRSKLKSWGFRWVRTAGCWSRSISGETEWRLELLAAHLGRPLVDAQPTIWDTDCPQEGVEYLICAPPK